MLRFSSEDNNPSTKRENRKNKWPRGLKNEKSRRRLTPIELFEEATKVVMLEGDRRWADEKLISSVTSGDLARQIHAYAITYGGFKAEEEEEEEDTNSRMKEKRMFRGLTIEVYKYWAEPAARKSVTYDARSFLDGNLDVGKAVLESYSRVLEGLAYNVVSWIDDVLYVDRTVRNRED